MPASVALGYFSVGGQERARDPERIRGTKAGRAPPRRALGDAGGGSLDTGFESGGEQAAWRTEGDVLLVSYAGSGWVPFARYQLSGDRLLLIYLQDGSRQLWSRTSGG